MSSNEPKNKKLKGNFHINIESNTNQNSQKGELKSIICDKHPTQTTQGNILTTATSMHKGLQEDDHLDTSENIILSPNIQNNIAQKMNQKYSFSKDYFDEVYQNLLLDEQRFYQKINCNYMIFQKDINDKMRAILVDWLIDIHYKLNMKKKTLYQCVFIIDAFLSLTETIRDKSGLEGDGSSLVGQAFGGNNPKIKLNNPYSLKKAKPSFRRKPKINITKTIAIMPHKKIIFSII